MLNKIIAIAIAAGFASASFAETPAAPAAKPAAVATADKKVDTPKSDAAKTGEAMKSDADKTVEPAHHTAGHMKKHADKLARHEHEHKAPAAEMPASK